MSAPLGPEINLESTDLIGKVDRLQRLGVSPARIERTVRKASGITEDVRQAALAYAYVRSLRMQMRTGWPRHPLV
jgi:hypothetical protein